MELKRMVRERQFWLAVFLAVGGMLLGTSYPEMKKGSLWPSGTFLQMVTGSLESRTVLFLIPITAVLPCGESYLRERQWNFLRFLLVRSDRKSYCRDQMMTGAVAGSLVWLIAAVMQVLFFFAFFRK